MEKLIITVAGDSRTSYPHNNLCPPQEDIAACAQQYVDAARLALPSRTSTAAARWRKRSRPTAGWCRASITPTGKSCTT
jgi:hypothetical protein